MKTIISTKQGPPEVLQLREVEQQKPGDGEILVRIHAATVTRGDVILRKLPLLMYLPMQLMGMRRKKTPGHEFAGKVVEVGKAVTKFKVGDKVFGTTTGLSVGSNAEYICVPEQWRTGVIAKMPSHATYEEAAALPVGGMTALEILMRGNIKPQQKVLVNGASGSVGTFAVQIAKNYFNANVTGVCSTRNIQLVKSLGADEVIDYSKEDFVQMDQSYDVIFDAVGKMTKTEAKKALNEKWRFSHRKNHDKRNRGKPERPRQLI